MADFETTIPKSNFEEALLPLLLRSLSIYFTEDPEHYRKSFLNSSGWFIHIPMEGSCQLNALSKGSKIITICQETLSVLIAPPSSQLKWLIQPTKSLTFRLVNGRVSITLRDDNTSASFDSECHESSKAYQKFVKLFQEILDSIKKEDQLNKLKGVQLLKIALIELVKYTQQEIPNDNIPPGKRKTFVEFLQFLERNFSKLLNSSQLAQAFGKSPQYLSKITQMMRGMSLNKFTQFFRLEMARNLLKENSVAQSAQLSGFKDSNVFIQAYKKQYGITPKQATKNLTLVSSRNKASEIHKTIGFEMITLSFNKSQIITPLDFNQTLIVANQTPERIELRWHPEQFPSTILRYISPFSRIHLSCTPGDKLSVTTQHLTEMFEMPHSNSIYVTTYS